MAENKVELRVSLDHEDGVVRAQGWLKGTVNMIVHEKMEVGKGQGDLSFQVVGKERTNVNLWGLLASMSNTTQEHVVFDEGKRLIHSFDDQQTLEPGTHCHLFSIYLPGFLPPSMFVEDKGGSSCSVDYVLTVMYGDTTKAERVLTLVGKPLSTKQYECYLRPACLPVKPLLGVIDHGSLVVAAKLENKHVAKGKKLNVCLAVRNQSKEAIEKVDVHVLQQIDWTAGGHEKQEINELDCCMDLDLPALKKDVDPAALATTGHYSNTDGPTAQEVSGVLQAELRSDLSAPENKIQLKIPTKALDSYYGKIVKIRHFLKINILTVAGIVKQHPSMRIPIEIFDSPIEPNVTHSPSKDKVEEVITTYWPSDEALVKHLYRDHSENSLQEETINEVSET